MANWFSVADESFIAIVHFFCAFEYLEVYYNGNRRHSTLGFISPVAFERQHQQNAFAS